MLSKMEVLSRIQECGLVAVVRAKSAEQAEKIAEALAVDGVVAIEITRPYRERLMLSKRWWQNILPMKSSSVQGPCWLPKRPER